MPLCNWQGFIFNSAHLSADGALCGGHICIQCSCAYIYDMLSSGASVIKSCLGFLIKLSPDKYIIHSQGCGCHICGVLITWPNPIMQFQHITSWEYQHTKLLQLGMSRRPIFPKTVSYLKAFLKLKGIFHPKKRTYSAIILTTMSFQTWLCFVLFEENPCHSLQYNDSKCVLDSKML